MTHKEFDQMMKTYLNKEIESQQENIDNLGDRVPEASQYFEGLKDAYQHVLNMFYSAYVQD